MVPFYIRAEENYHHSKIMEYHMTGSGNELDDIIYNTLHLQTTIGIVLAAGKNNLQLLNQVQCFNIYACLHPHQLIRDHQIYRVAKQKVSTQGFWLT